jgi:glutamate--cysteine ligase catalytic subunit
LTSLSISQIEYLVVAFDDADRNVKLSLRQADILEALANNAELVKQGGGVPDLNQMEPKYV